MSREEIVGQNELPELRPHQGAALFRMRDVLGSSRIAIVIEAECAAIQKATEVELRERYLYPGAYVRELVSDAGELPSNPYDQHDANIVNSAIRPTVRARAMELGIDFEAVTTVKHF